MQIGQRSDRKAGEVFRFKKVEYFDAKKQAISSAYSGQNIEIKIFFESFGDNLLKDVNIGMAFSNNRGYFYLLVVVVHKDQESMLNQDLDMWCAK